VDLVQYVVGGQAGGLAFEVEHQPVAHGAVEDLVDVLAGDGEAAVEQGADLAA
jgi:hypothetical protein